MEYKGITLKLDARGKKVSDENGKESNKVVAQVMVRGWGGVFVYSLDNALYVWGEHAKWAYILKHFVMLVSIGDIHEQNI